jgi:hypothetical protein
MGRGGRAQLILPDVRAWHQGGVDQLATDTQVFYSAIYPLIMAGTTTPRGRRLWPPGRARLTAALPVGAWARGTTETLRDGNYVDTSTRMLMQLQYANPDNSRSIRNVLCQPVGMVSKYVPHAHSSVCGTACVAPNVRRRVSQGAGPAPV